MVVAAKSTSDASKVVPFPPNPNSPQSTINTVEREIREAGGDATAVPVDTRDFTSVRKLVDLTVKVNDSRVLEAHAANLGVDIRPARRPCLQFGSHMVGRRGRYAHEEVPVDAEGKP